MFKANGKRSLAVAALALCCATAQAQAPLVSNQELQEKWLDKILSVVLANGNKAKLIFRTGWALEISGSVTDVGKWRWNEPAGYCASWKTIRAGQERCFTVQRKGNDYLVLNPDGSHSATVVEIQ